MKIVLMGLCAILNAFLAQAAVQLPKIFSDHMMLQRDRPIKVWGWADKKEKVTVRLNGQTVSARADGKGEWMVTLPAMKYGGPYAMSIQGKNTIVIQDILIGDVWICSGQSNMEWTMRNTKNGAKEIAESNHPSLRLFTVRQAASFTPSPDVSGQWMECNPGNTADFSAVAYFFGRRLTSDLHIPIGLINTSWGGTNIQAWTSWDVMGKEERYKSEDLRLLEEKMKTMNEKKKAFLASLQNDQGDREQWFSVSANTGWKNIEQPRSWESSSIGNADGTVWFRKEFDLPAGMESKEGVLSLGPIDDNDVTYLNGIKIGAVNSWNTDRSYTIPTGILKTGKNVIVIKITDTGGGGGLYGKEDQLYLQVDGKTVSLSGTWQFRPSALNTDYGIQDTGPNSFPSQLYNAMISPLTSFGIKGAIWYQGEANTYEAFRYRSLFPQMIKDWRAHWGYDFPFFWAQLANFMKPDGQPAESEWAELREAQSMTLSLPATGQAVLIDIGEADDIHPRNKQDVGNRLALAAEKVAYRMEVVHSGPQYVSSKREGDKMIVQLTNIGSGLVAHDKYGYLKGFAIAGEDRKFVWAKSYIQDNKIVVFREGVSNPVAVRYAWGDNPDDANLYNKEGLPAVPFRSDDWEGRTAAK